MIIARSPLRITLGGGGTDLPSYYRDHEGFLIAAAIDKYVYVTVMRPFTEGIFLKYSQLEHVNQIAEVKHPIIRECLHILDLKTPRWKLQLWLISLLERDWDPPVVLLQLYSKLYTPIADAIYIKKNWQN
ncbi:hypothetical protein [Cylindrospermopsis raciborskii]|uniref:hypothetical protein n=1 Tax=Cylindrospermopsis raciborskii TaxID=77022 RepID=UPI00215B4F61|nr:hypothetical protein [Cylindrospermopsis raciborskii]